MLKRGNSLFMPLKKSANEIVGYNNGPRWALEKLKAAPYLILEIAS